MPKTFLAGVALVVMTAATAAPPGGEAPQTPEPDLDLALSRGAPTCAVVASRRQHFVIRLDRDIQRARFEVRPPESGEPSALRAWQVKLFRLNATRETDAVDVPRAVLGRPIWERVGVADKPAWDTTVRAFVPRSEYVNLLIQVSPRSPAAPPIEVRAAAVPVPWTHRVQWLMGMRTQWQPSQRPDLTRKLMWSLTDDEVRHWCGVRDRDAFLRIWNRLTAEEIARQFPGPEEVDLTTAGHALPNHLLLPTDGFLIEPPGTPTAVGDPR
jgi:hypothetical protein